jgi:predicted enzyme related to lactoylglutathione lyase
VMQAAPGAAAHWLTYVLVETLETARDRAKALGATLLADVIAVPGIGRFVILKDPQGAIICPFQGEPS